MSIDLLPDTANLLAWAFVVFLVLAGITAGAVIFSAGFRRLMYP